MSDRCVYVRVSGRVQGVWFRESTRRCAEKLELSGWVRNLPSGEVEALFAGEPDAVDEALAFVQVGPAHARVEHVVVEERDAQRAPGPRSDPSFTIR